MSTYKKRSVAIATICAVAVGAVVWFGSILSVDPRVSTGEAVVGNMRRLNADQYRRVIQDVFGDGIKIDGRFVETEQRIDGLLAIGASELSVSSVGFEAAKVIGGGIARQLVDPTNRAQLLPCEAETENTMDTKCARQVISEVGRLLFRRPLSEDEIQTQVQVVQLAVDRQQDYYLGLEKSLTNLLVSPHFLFHIEYIEPDPLHDGEYRLTAWSKASRLSFLLWGTTPDAALLDEAGTGELHTREGLQRQVDRLLNSPRLVDGVRAFFSDMLTFDGFETLSKDHLIYPQFTTQVKRDAREQTLLTIVDHLLYREEAYPELFTSPRTFLTPSLAALMAVPVLQTDTSHLAPAEWVPYEFPADDNRSGILAQPSFVALHSHPGRTSPTNRGKALRENFLCQEVPAPPANVDFNIVEDTSNPDYKTMRQRLSAHATMPTCAGCHKIMDPIGLALENFDGDGSYRQKENGVVIDTAGEMDGMKFSNAYDLGKVVADNPATVSCLVNRVFSFGTGHKISREEHKWLKDVRKNFASKGYKFPNLLRDIATSDEFYRGELPEEENAESVAAR